MNLLYLKVEQEYLNSNKSLTKICEEHNVFRQVVAPILRKKGIILKRKTSLNTNIFKTIDTEEKAYWLGFLYADGYVCHNLKSKRYVIEVGLSNKDIDHLLKLKSFLNCGVNVKHRPEINACRLSVYSKEMCKDLISLGCIQKKSFVLKFPSLSIVSEKLMRHFIRGYFDGDGSIGFNKRSKSLHISVLGTKEFISTLQNLYPDSVVEKDSRFKGNTLSLRFRTKEGVKFLFDIYNNSTIYLERKFERYKYILSDCRSGKKFLELQGIKNGES
jgi:DNA-binding transcriptional regulator WhiA